jgi:Leucine-rich repeat (LRR) protein
MGVNSSYTVLSDATLTFTGSGTTDPSEYQGIYDFLTNSPAENMLDPWSGPNNWNDGSGGIILEPPATWDPSIHFDPCRDRLSAFWCERGHVVSFSCTSCGITGELDGASMATWERLQVLDLAENDPDFTGTYVMNGKIPCEIGQLTWLTDINLDNNAFTGFANCLGDLKNVTVLSAQGMLISSLPSSMSGMTGLQMLLLGGNKLTSLIDLSAMTNLSNVDLSRNSFDSVPDFSNTAVQSLDLSNCGISSLDVSAFDNMPRLFSIDISQNGIKGRLPKFVGAQVRALRVCARVYVFV